MGFGRFVWLPPGGKSGVMRLAALSSPEPLPRTASASSWSGRSVFFVSQAGGGVPLQKRESVAVARATAAVTVLPLALASVAVARATAAVPVATVATTTAAVPVVVL